MATYFTVLTRQGAALEADSKASGTPIKFTHMAVGDGGGAPITPSAEMTGLIQEKWRGGLNDLYVDPDNPGQYIAEAEIPQSVGGFTVREVGLYTDGGIMFLVGSTPETVKPVLAEGASKSLYLRLPVAISSEATVVLLVDPSKVMATRKFVEEEIEKVSLGVDALQTAISEHVEQDEAYGIMPWSNAINYKATGLSLGTDGVLYQALQASGPDTAAGPKPLGDTTFWKKHIEQVDAVLSGIVDAFSGTFGGPDNKHPINRKTGAPDLSYAICDGGTYTAPDGVSVQTPDLRNRFIIGAGSTYAPGATGGSLTANTNAAGSHTHTQGATGSAGDHAHSQGATGGTALTIAQLPSHRHASGSAVDSRALNAVYGSTNANIPGAATANGEYRSGTPALQAMGSYVGNDQAHTHTNPNTSTVGGHTHTNPTTASSGGHAHTVSTLSPYYALCFVMKL